MATDIKNNSKLAVQLYYGMKRIRLTEEKIAEKYSEWKIRCPTHLCTGQEAIASAIGMLLRKDDFVVSTHRAHGHYLAKGGDLKRMIAEIYGKSTGCSGGKGGSMHLIDKSVGFMGSTAIVGGTIPIAVGLGLSIKLHQTNQISCVFFGDGAVEEGVFYESVNFAVLKKLPVLFICENNFYSVYSPLNVRQPKGRRIFEMVSAMGCPAFHGDGNNAVEVFEKVGASIDSLRKGNGPVFFEFETYRWREHCGHNYDNHIGYRTENEFLQWKDRDPVCFLERQLIQNSMISEKECENINKELLREIEEAFQFAEKSPFPETKTTFQHLFHE